MEYRLKTLFALEKDAREKTTLLTKPFATRGRRRSNDKRELPEKTVREEEGGGGRFDWGGIIYKWNKLRGKIPGKGILDNTHIFKIFKLKIRYLLIQRGKRR